MQNDIKYTQISNPIARHGGGGTTAPDPLDVTKWHFTDSGFFCREILVDGFRYTEPEFLSTALLIDKLNDTEVYKKVNPELEKVLEEASQYLKKE